MLQLAFSVTAPTSQGQSVRVVGAIPALGQWNPSKAFKLEEKDGVWVGPTITCEEGNKCQFKLIRDCEEGAIVWQDLPNNSNRKFKPKNDCTLHLEWSKPEGRVSQLNKGTYKVNGFPAAIIKPQNQTAQVKKHKEFDPYENAREEETDSEDDQFQLVRGKMSDEIVINSGELQDIYYSANSVEVFAALMQKTKVYVISRECDIKKPLHAYVEKQLLNLPTSFVARWITAESFLKNTKSIFPKKGSLYEIRYEELHLQSLYSRTSYFILLQLDTALELKHRSGRVPTCLLLPAERLRDVLKVLDRLQHISLICFDDPEANREFYEHLCNHVGEESTDKEQRQVITPSIGAIVQQLKRLRFEQMPRTVNTLCNISEQQALKQYTTQNSMCIIDGNIIQKYPIFSIKLMNALPHNTLLAIIADESPSQSMLALRDKKNVTIISNNFEKVTMQGREYNPLRKFKETIEILRMKSKLYLQSYGGQITEKQSSFIYCLPQGREDWASKVECECRAVMRQFSWVRVSRKGIKVKMTWSLSKKVRLLRTLCEIKYLNYGTIGDFYLLVHSMSFKEMKEELNLLLEHKPKLFGERHETRLIHNSYDYTKPTVTNILPQSKTPPLPHS